MSGKITIANNSKLFLNFLSDLQQIAAGFQARITVRKGGITADAKSFIEILALIEAKSGHLEVVAEGEDASVALGAIRNLAIQNYLKLNPDLTHRNN